MNLAVKYCPLPRSVIVSWSDPARVREHNNAFTEVRYQSSPFVMYSIRGVLPQTLKSSSSRESGVTINRLALRYQDHNHVHIARLGL